SDETRAGRSKIWPNVQLALDRHAEPTHRNQVTPGDREKMISQIPPNRSRRPARATLAIKGEPELTASDLARYQYLESGAKGTRTPDPLLAKQVLFQLSYSPAPRRFKGTRSAPARRAAELRLSVRGGAPAKRGWAAPTRGAPPAQTQAAPPTQTQAANRTQQPRQTRAPPAPDRPPQPALPESEQNCPAY